MEYVGALGALYHRLPSLRRADHEPAGHRWINVAAREQSVFSYARFDGREHALVVLNRTPVPRPGYRRGVPAAARYRVVINSEAPQCGGGGFPVPETARTEAVPYHGFEQSLAVSLPPLSMRVRVPDRLSEEAPATLHGRSRVDTEEEGEDGQNVNDVKALGRQ